MNVGFPSDKKVRMKASYLSKEVTVCTGLHGPGLQQNVQIEDRSRLQYNWSAVAQR